MQLNILPCIFFETQNTAGVRVVDETSSDGGYPQCSPIPIDATHITITKPRNYHHITVGQTLKLIDEAIPSSSYRYNHEIDFPDDAGSSVPSISAHDKKPEIEKRKSLNWFDVKSWSYQKVAIFALAAEIIVELTSIAGLWASVGGVRLFSLPRALRAAAITLLAVRLAGRWGVSSVIAFVLLYFISTLIFLGVGVSDSYMLGRVVEALEMTAQTLLTWLAVAGCLGYLNAALKDTTVLAIAVLVGAAQAPLHLIFDWAAPAEVFDWRTPESYKRVQDADITAIAWEYLRRNPDYRRDYEEMVKAGRVHNVTAGFRGRWGLCFRF
jgi:hypothetical protein